MQRILACTYINAARNPINVNSNKSLVGIGRAGVIKGKSLRLINSVLNGFASRVTISNFLLLGFNDFYTFVGNYIYYISGRALYINTNATALIILFYSVNNYFRNIAGYAFDVSVNTYVLLEGNYFDTVTILGFLESGNVYAVNTVPDASSCTSYLGYICEWNRVTSNSGALGLSVDSAALFKFSGYKSSLVRHILVTNVPASVLANAGIGKI
ncbi:polysaccharide lyase family 1 protein [Cadophora sp. DSE1049]|nr:polysaccharide lyase family 1 protein [Cadophora sp. DSE1049]